MFFVNIIFSLSLFFFFSSRRRHTRFDCDWSSDVCSSDLHTPVPENSRYCSSCGADVSGGGAPPTTSNVELLQERLQRLIEGRYRIERSEERRVGEEGRSRGAPYHLKKKKKKKE